MTQRRHSPHTFSYPEESIAAWHQRPGLESVGFGTGSGQTIQDVFPSAADRAASQCNDFNGNAVLPGPPECSDGIDNDLDTFIDFPADPQCADAADDDESS